MSDYVVHPQKSAPPRPEPGSSFLHDRASWLKVETVERGEDQWDVALVIDGTYHGEDLVRRAGMARWFAQWIADETGLPVRVGT